MNPLSTIPGLSSVAALLSFGAFLSLVAPAPAVAADTLAWDKTFPRSANVNHRKVSFHNRLGIQIVADLYIPKTADLSKNIPPSWSAVRMAR